MMPSVGAKLGKLAKALANWSSSRPPASAISAEINVRAIAATERNTSVSRMIATATPISSPTGAVALLGLVHDRAVAGDLETGALADLGRLLEPLARRLAERGGGVVVLDRHVGDARVLGELAAALGERVRRGGHVRLGADLLDGPLDRGLTLGVAERARVHGEDDVRGIARRCRKAVVQHVDRGLRFGAGRLEVVDERAAGGARADAERDEHDRHDRK